MSQKLNHDAKSIGARFRSARSLVPDLNRKSFCERYQINRYTMQSWENGLHVSKGKNVEKFIEALAREGVYCSAEWLIDGIGDAARPLLAKSQTKTSSREILPRNENLERIISTLKEAHVEAGETLITCPINDDAMAPKFMAGDMVFGRSIKDKASLHQKYCIAKMSQSRMITRKVLVTKDGFLLLALDERVPSFLLNLESEIYAVVWHLMAQ